MGSIEQRAIGSVVDIKFGAAAAFHLDHQRAIFGRQRAPRFAPEFGGIADRQILERAVDGGEIMVERDRFQVGIDRRKAAADIDDIDCDRSGDDRGPDAFQRMDIGKRRHRLAADMEADAKAVRCLPRPLQ